MSSSINNTQVYTTLLIIWTCIEIRQVFNYFFLNTTRRLETTNWVSFRLEDIGASAEDLCRYNKSFSNMDKTLFLNVQSFWKDNQQVTNEC